MVVSGWVYPESRSIESKLQSVSTSDYHTMLASGSADGSVKIGSSLNGLHRKRHHVSLLFQGEDWLTRQNIIDHRSFEMDYDEHTKEYRMVEDFVPEVMSSTRLKTQV